MRRLLLILMAISLSLVTTSYACSMGGAVVHSVCCCDGASESAPARSPDCSADMMFGEQSDGCCSILIASSTSIQGPAESPAAPDLPVVGRAAAIGIPSLPPRTLGVAPKLLARKGASPPLYLRLGHLLR